jgi:predicted metalloendopeptidase
MGVGAMLQRPNSLPSIFALFASAGVAATSLAACETPVPPNDPHTAPTATATATASASASAPRGTNPGDVDESAMNPQVSPCDDFYQNACGGWLKNTPIPAEESSWTRSFDVIQQSNEKLLREIIEQDAKAPPADQPYSKAIGDYYASCVDEDAVEKLGTAPLEPYFKAIDKVKDAKSLAILLADFHRKGIGAFFDFDSGQDFKDATLVIGQLTQSGLGMPDRDYYLKDDPKMKALREKYEAHLGKLLVLAGEKEADARTHATAVMAMETALARLSMSTEDQRDPQKIYHRLERTGLEKKAPAFPWAAYFKAIETPDVTALNVAQPEFFRAVGALMEASPSLQCKDDKAAKAGDKKVAGDKKAGDKAGDKKAGDKAGDKKAADEPKEEPVVACPSQPKKFPTADVKAYLRVRVLDALARTLPKRFLDESFDLERAFTGAEELPPRWKRCVRAIDRAMGEAVAVPFVKKVLGDEGKADVRQMVQNIEAAMGDRLGAIQWMDDSTRAKAREKLAAITNKIAFPDKFRNYDALVIKRGDAMGNRLNAIAFEARRRLAKIGKPLDRSEWFFPPQTVNAAYDPSLNEMQFPGGILQAPFYARKASAAMNYGAIGMVIGHELTHGFDDEGRQFDAKGNLTDWWSPAVGKEFDQRASCVEKQFDGFVVAGDTHLKGKLTLGENIADLGGLRLTFAAWKKVATPVPADAKYTADQQFFYGFAQAWCTNIRDELLQLFATTNPHSPPQYRVNGPLSNMTEFREAFQCKDGPMVRKDRCEVW